MPPSRFRNEVGYGEVMPRSRNNAASASGDSTACTIYQHQDTALARHQNKLPRSVRYELENALIGLCDVWFDEIKPHLVRNNIKLHITGSSARAGGDQQCARHTPPTPPLHRAPPSSPLSDDCLHLDPGAVPDRPRRVASCASSWSPPPAASSAPLGRLRAPLRRPLSPLISMPPSPRDGPQIQTNNCEKKQERPCIRRKRRRFRAQGQPSWRVPRLCRTHPVLSRGAGSAGGPLTKSASELPPCDNYYRFIVPRRESVMKNKTTQTEPALSVSRACQSRSPGYWSPGSRSPGLRIPGLRNPVLRSPGPSSPGLRSSAPRSTKCSPPSCSPDSSSPDRALSPLIPPSPDICNLKRLPPILQDDLIDIIAASNEKRLSLLYSSSERNDHTSFLNLFSNCKLEKNSPKKLPPWR